MLQLVFWSPNLLVRYAAEPGPSEIPCSLKFPMIKVPLFEQEIETEVTRSTRNRRNPARFQDYIPTSAVPTQIGRFLTKKQRLEAMKARADAAQPENDPELPSDEGSGAGDPTCQITTSPDTFGVFRKYSSLPSHNPGAVDPFSDLPCAPSSMARRPQLPVTDLIGSGLTTPSAGSSSDPLANSENPTVDLLLSWYSEGSSDGATNLNHLVNCLRDPRFDISKLKDFNAVSALRRFEKTHLHSKSKSALEPGDGWKCGSVTIRVPCVRHPQREEDAPEFTIDGVYYRDATEVIAKELMDPDSFDNIHLTPFEEWWRPTEASEPVRVYSETYTSDAMLELEKKLQETSKGATDPQLETFILAALLYSDGTRLAQFGHASLWPVYMYIGNASKYIRSQPNSFSAHHIAYLPTVWTFFPKLSAMHLMVHFQLPDAIKEFYKEHYDVYPNADMMAHLKRELIHASLRLVFGGAFADAKKNGRVTRCADDVLRRWLLEVILHSADYMEK